MDKGGDHVSSWEAGPLWCHVTNTLDRDELEAVVGFGVAGHLTVGVPGSPGIGDRPAELLNPLLGAVGGNRTIGVTRVEHKASLALEDAVDPHGSLILHVVVES